MARSRDFPNSLYRFRTRKLFFERLEDRSLLSLTHLYTFNDGSANDWIGNAHGALVNGATVVNGQLTLSNMGVTSGQSSTVQYAKLPANVLSSADATVEVWFTATSSASWARVFDIGNQSGTSGDSYLFFTPHSAANDSRGVLRPSAGAERVASGALTDDGTQHMAAVVVDTSAGMLRLYLDGAASGTALLNSANAGSVNDSLAYFGRSLFNADPGFTGSINEVRIYDESVSGSELAIHAANGPDTAARSPLSRQAEYLDRGVVAFRTGSSSAYIGWRLLGTDRPDIAFNLYRSANGGVAVKLNATPITATMNFSDSSATGLNLAVSNSYFVRPVIDGIEQAASESFLLAGNAAIQQYLNIPLVPPPGGTTPDGLTYTYNANDASVGDVDGDGQYEIILKWDSSLSKDSSQDGFTGNTYLDCYKLDGTRLWRIDEGQNIRAGAHYTQFIVYDLDGDGKAEVALKTAPGTIDGLGNPVLLAGDHVTDDYRNATTGRINSGPEYLTIFNGQTGAALATTAYKPDRVATSSWGDDYGNRQDRYLMAVAYLDGVHPSLVLGRGIFPGQTSGHAVRNEITAWNWRGGQLNILWWFRADKNASTFGLPDQNTAYVGQGNYEMDPADVDGDGKDEIVYGSMTVDDNGQPLYSTGLGHGDALHVSDMDPTHPGLEIYMPMESPGSNGHITANVHDAATGAILWSTLTRAGDADPDVGRGNAFDIDPNYPGFETWDSYNADIYNISTGTAIQAKPSNMFVNFGVWWDADPLRELEDGTTISDWKITNGVGGRSNFDLDPGTSGTQQFAPNASSINGTKSTPCLIADIFGDWREEVVWRRSDNTALEIFSTIIPATSRMYTLMDDSQYRESVAWQNVGYNQPTQPGFFIGAGMAAPPTPQTYIATQLVGDYNGDSEVNASDYVLWRKTLGSMFDLRADGNHDGIVGSADYAVLRANFGATAPATTAGSVLQSEQAISIGGQPASAPLLVYADAESQIAWGKSEAAHVRATAVPLAQNPASDLLLMGASWQSTEQIGRFTHLAHEDAPDDAVRLDDSQNCTFDVVSAAFERMSRADFLSFKPKF